MIRNLTDQAIKEELRDKEFRDNVMIVISELEKKNCYFLSTFESNKKTNLKIKHLWEILNN